MFDALRKMILPIIIIVLVFFVAMIVLQWGMGMSSRSMYQAANVAGSVNGEEITWETYNRAYNTLIRAAMEENPDEDLPDSKIEEIRSSAWQQVLYDKILQQEVEKHNIIVTDQELYQYLSRTPPQDLISQPSFQTDGKFDYQKYMMALADPNMAGFWAQMDPIYRNEIKKLKAQELIIQAAHVSESEIREFFMADQERVKVGLINVAYARFSSPSPTSTDEEKRAFFDEHIDDYNLDDRSRLNIVMLEKEPAPLDWAEAEEQAKALRDSVMDGADFERIASEFSQDPSAATNKGDLGWFSRGEMVKDFSDRAFSLKDDEISEPVRTQYGWHIIKKLGSKTEKEVPRGKTEAENVEKVHCLHILVKAEASAETLQGLQSRLIEFATVAKDDGFLAAAEELSLPVKTTANFFKDKNIQFIGNDPVANAFAFEHEKGAISDVMENRNAFFVIEVADRIPAGPAKYEDAAKAVAQDIVLWKVSTLCRDTANAIWAEIEKGVDWKNAAKKYSEEYETPDPFKLGGYVKGLGRDPKAIGAAFSLKEPGQTLPPIDYDQGTVMMKLIERTNPDLSQYAGVRDSISNELMIQKQRELYARWFQIQIQNSAIVNNTERTNAPRDSYY
ncbi:MAG TPA: peptidylprolyl isomerase [candidate division Zixibacteria bacterium]|nr:peptidylprolyl isomerase [candidate division Zixibacteria bacterium]